MPSITFDPDSMSMAQKVMLIERLRTEKLKRPVVCNYNSSTKMETLQFDDLDNNSLAGDYINNMPYGIMMYNGKGEMTGLIERERYSKMLRLKIHRFAKINEDRTLSYDAYIRCLYNDEQKGYTYFNKFIESIAWMEDRHNDFIPYLLNIAKSNVDYVDKAEVSCSGIIKLGHNYTKLMENSIPDRATKEEFISAITLMADAKVCDPISAGELKVEIYTSDGQVISARSKYTRGDYNKDSSTPKINLTLCGVPILFAANFEQYIYREHDGFNLAVKYLQLDNLLDKMRLKWQKNVLTVI